MIRNLTAGLVLATLGILAACSSSVDVVAPADASAPIPDAGATLDSAVNTPVSCSTPLASPECATTKPAPKSKAEIDKFVVSSAIPIRCGSGKNSVWDVRPLVELYGSNRMFMVGEVHGTNEIGIVSSVILKELASRKLVTVLGFELPMDYETQLQRYVNTGEGIGSRFVRGVAQNMFGAILTRTAHELADKGLHLRISAVDFPSRPDVAEEAIREVAEKLTTQKTVVLDTLPHVVGDPTKDEFPKANAYFELITSKKAEICAELAESDCDRLVAMTHALWTSILAFDDSVAQTPEWFARREEVIYYNMHAKMADSADRMFLHMGAAHTNKFAGSAGSRMAREYPGTKGKVFSVAPAYSDGSNIWYGGRRVPLTAEPKAITSPFTQVPADPVFVSVTRTGADCTQNPLTNVPEASVNRGGTMGETYDGYIYYGAVTPEDDPSVTVLSPDDDILGSSLLAHLKRIERRAQALQTMRGLEGIAPRPF